MMWWLSEIEVIENQNFLTPFKIIFVIYIQIKSKKPAYHITYRLLISLLIHDMSIRILTFLRHEPHESPIGHSPGHSV